MGRLIFIIILLATAGLIVVFADTTTPEDDERERKVEILHANSLEHDRRLGPDVRRLLGDVRLKHEEVLMYCDSAHYYGADNKVHAYGNVHINQGDTINLYADSIHYFGERQFAEARGNVKLVDRETTLKTENLDFDIENNIAFYPDSGRIERGDDVIESLTGYYYSDEKTFLFKQNVNVRTPDYTIESDTLRYNTETETAYFSGPTTIVTEDLHIYCESGWYNTQTDISQFNENTVIKYDNSVITADSIYYDHAKKSGKGYYNVEMNDTVERVILEGNYAFFEREPEYTMLTDSTLFTHYNEENDSLFLHADTLESFFEGDHRIMNAYYGARFFSKDMQGKCDSLYYSFQDSIIRMYTDPVLWTNQTQLTADHIQIHSRDDQVDSVYMDRNSFIVSFEEDDYYNQIKGREMTGYFNQGELTRVRVVGNAETLYYPREENDIIGLNQVASTSLFIFMKDNSPHRIRFETNPEATLFPLEDLTDSDLFLEGFRWLDDIRPRSKIDLFKN